MRGMASPGYDTVDIVLRDGSTIRVRPVVSTDAAGLRALFAGLSMDSLHRRFFSAGPSLDAEVLRLLGAGTAGDAVTVGEVGGRIVAVAGYTRATQTPARAEVAFAIADDYQGRGIGTRLLEHLASVARARSVHYFDAYVLADNGPMLRVFLDSGFEAHEDVAAGVISAFR